jgi:hypothetical protein
MKKPYVIFLVEAHNPPMKRINISSLIPDSTCYAQLRNQYLNMNVM